MPKLPQAPIAELSPEEFAAGLGVTSEVPNRNIPSSEPLSPEDFAAGIQDVFPAQPSKLQAFAGQGLEALSSVPGLARIGVEKLGGEAPFFGGLEAGLRGLSQEVYPQETRGRGGVVEDISGAAGSLVGAVPAMLAGPGAAALQFGAQNAVPLYHDIKAATGDEEAAMWGLLFGGAVGQLERFGAEKALASFVKKLAGKKLAGAVSQAVLMRALTTAGSEAGTEALQQGLTDLLYEALSGEDIENWKNILRTLPPALVLGGGAGTIDAALSRRPTSQRQAQAPLTAGKGPESAPSQPAEGPIPEPGAAAEPEAEVPPPRDVMEPAAPGLPAQKETGTVEPLSPEAPGGGGGGLVAPAPSGQEVTPAPGTTAPPVEPSVEEETAGPDLPETKKIVEAHAGPPVRFPSLSEPIGKLKRTLRKFGAKYGLAPESAGRALEIRKGEEEAELSEIGDRARDLDAAVSKIHGKAWRAKPIAKELDAALEDPAKLAVLPPEVGRPLAAMRAHMDRMIRLQVKEGAIKADTPLAEQVLGSTGKYSTRAYRAFYDTKHAEKVTPEVRGAFANLLASEGKTPAEAEAITDAILQEAKEVAANPFAQVAASKLGHKNLSIYKRRKAVPRELRALLGEIEDPTVNYANSVMRIAGVVARHRAYTSIRASGLKEGWLSESGKRAKGHSATISSEGNPSLGPLDGMHTTPDIKEALTGISSKEMASWVRFAMKANSFIKWGKVIGQPTGFVRNLASNIPISLANGHLPRWGKKESWKHAFAKGGLEERKRLIRLGIIGDGINTYEWDDLRQSMKRTPDELVDLNAGPLRAAKAGAEKLYQAADALPKIVGFYAEEAALIDAGLSPAEAEAKAADRIRDLYPSPERMGAMLKNLRRQPVLGQYFAFRAEMFRTLVNRMRLIKEELGSDNPKIRAMGRRRVVGQVAAASLTPAAVATINMLNGIDGEEDDDRREFTPAWDSDSEIIWFGDSKKGEYIDLSDIDPMTQFTDPIMRVAHGEDPQAALSDWLKDQGSTFFGPAPISKLAVELIDDESAKRGQGLLGWAGGGGEIDNKWIHLLKSVAPGIALWAAREAEEGFDPGSVATFALARRYDFDAEKSLGYDIRGFAADIARSTKKANKTGDRDTQATSRQEAFEEIQRKVQAAGRLGVPMSTIQRMLDKTLSRQVTNQILLGGSMPPYVPKVQ